MAVSLDVIRTLTTKARTEGVDAARAELERYAKAQQGVASSADTMRTANDNATRSVLSAEKAFDALERKIDPIARANADLAREQAKVARALNDGSVSAERAANVLGLLAAKHDAAVSATRRDAAAATDFVGRLSAWSAESNSMIGRLSAWSAAVDGNRAALDSHSKSVGLARHEWINLSRQAQDIGVSLAGGQSPFTVLAQQGSQVADVFASSGAGPTAALRAFGATIVPVVFNPLTALAAALGTVGYASYQFSEQQRQLERSLNGTGRAAGVTADRLREIGTAGARGGGFGSGQGVELAGQYAASGVAGGNIGTLVSDTRRFARSFDLDLKDASQEIVQIVSDQGLGAFEKRFGAASAATKDWIRSLEASGRYIEAQTEKTRLFDEAVKKAKESSGLLQGIWDKIAAGVSNAAERIGSAFAPSLEQQIERLEAVKATIGPAPTNALDRFLRGDTSGRAQYVQNQIDGLRRQVAERDARAASDAADLDLNRRSQLAAGIVDALQPDSAKLRDLREKLSAVKPLTETSEGLAKLGDRAQDAQRTVEQLTYGVTNFQTAAEKMREDGQLAARAAEAYTFAERSAVAAEQARIAVLRETGDVARAAIAAEQARNQLIAEGNRRADDLLRQARNESELVGLKPGDRALKQIEQQYRDFRDQNAPKSDMSAPVVTGFARAGSAAVTLADALTRSAARISNPPAAGVGIRAGRESVAASRVDDPRDVAPYIRERAAAYGIDPDVALRVARAEGLRDFYGDNRTSFGALQLHVGGGVGDEFRRATGLDPSDPANERATIDFALRVAAQRGWGPWRGAARVGIGQWEGIAGNDNGAPRVSRADAVSRSAERLAIGTAQSNIRLEPLREADQELDRQIRLLDARDAAMGRGTQQGVEALRRQELLNEANRNFNDLLPEQERRIDALAKKYGEFSRRQEEAAQRERTLKAELDLARSGVSDSLGGVVKAAVRGEDIGAALQQSLSRLQDNIIDFSVSRITEPLLGQTGTTNAGLFGSLLGSLGFGGAQQVGTATIQAGTVVVNGGVAGGSGLLGNLFGDSSTIPTMAQGGSGLDMSSGGGLLSGLVSWFGSLGHNAGGTDDWRGGLTWVGERGPELLNLPRGSQITPNTDAIRMARDLAKVSNDNSSRAVAAAPAKSEVYFHGAPEGTRVKETVDSRGGRRMDVMFQEGVDNAVQTPSGKQALRAAGRVIKR